MREVREPIGMYADLSHANVGRSRIGRLLCGLCGLLDEGLVGAETAI